jgi:thiol-disulfide isomerase/thioredoxin
VWGSWCSPCRQEAAGLQAASVATRADAQFIGLNTRDASPAAPVAFLRTQGVTYPSIFDPSGQSLLQLAGQVPPSAIPSTLVLDRQGRVAIRVLGQVSQATLVDMVAEVAAGR